MPYRENLALFTDEFATDTMRNMGWKAFLKKIRWKEQIDFSVVMKCIKENLQVYWDKNIMGMNCKLTSYILYSSSIQA